MKYSFILISCFLINLTAFSQTVGTIDLDFEGVSEGYTLISPLNAFSTYLIDNCGEIVKQWDSAYPPGNEVFLDEEGRLWRAGRLNTDGAVGAGGRGGVIEVYEWNGLLAWSMAKCNSSECMHHDFKRLENGNLLILVWDRYTAEEAIEQGADPALLDDVNGVWSEYLEEISIDLSQSNQATTVWQWHVWDHLVQDFDETKPNFGDVNSHEKINLNFGQVTHPDWLHANAIDYNQELDQIIMSIPHFDEFWIIDHSLTLQESATDQGDLLYRWGNPMTYGQGTEEDKQLFFNHNPHWVKEGLNFENKIMVFNNRIIDGEELVSAVDVITPEILEDGSYAMNNEVFLPESREYRYLLPEDLTATNVSGAQVLENGNLLVCSGTNGTLLEITEDEGVVWRYKTPVDANNEPVAQGANPAEIQFRWLFRAYKYTPGFEGFEGKDLTPSGYIETNSGESFCEVISVSETNFENKINVYPNPSKDWLNFTGNSGVATLEIFSILGNVVHSETVENQKLNVSHLESGSYILKFTNADGSSALMRFVKE